MKLTNWIKGLFVITERVEPEEETGWIIRGEKGTSLRLDRDDMRARK